MKDIKALLDLRTTFFEIIKDLASKKQFNSAYQLILYTDQDPSWISIGKSEIDNAEYKYNYIELIEGIMNRLFDWSYTVKSVHTLNDKGMFASTAVVTVRYKLPGEEKYRKQGGVATSYCTDVKSLIIGSPKAVSQAKKNACKYIGKLLGLDLNREQEELPIVQVNDKQKADDDIVAKELKEVTDAVNAAATKEMAMAILNNSPFKLYPQLKELVNQKIN